MKGKIESYLNNARSHKSLAIGRVDLRGPTYLRSKGMPSTPTRACAHERVPFQLHASSDSHCCSASSNIFTKKDHFPCWGEFPNQLFSRRIRNVSLRTPQASISRAVMLLIIRVSDSDVCLRCLGREQT